MTREEFHKLGERFSQSPFAKRNYSAHPSRTVPYIRYRLLRPFLKRKFNRFQAANPRIPWIAPDAIRFLETALTTGGIGFEFGSGNSTIFYSSYFQTLITVEHHRPWFEIVTQMLAEDNITNVDLKFIPPSNNVPSQHLSSEQQLFLTEEEYPIKDDEFEGYINSISDYPENHFDFIAIDGRARKSCLLKSLSKLKSGGILLLDNSERKRYDGGIKSINGWPKLTFTTGLTDTTVWLKP